MNWLCLMLLVLLRKGLAVNLTTYSPENTLVVDENNTAVVSCNANFTLDNGSVINWFRSTHKMGEPPQLITSCLKGTTVNKYECDTVGGSTRLKIHDVQNEDSGVYYCSILYRAMLIIAKWTRLIVRNNPVSSVSVYRLTQTTHDNVTVQLACFVQNTSHWIYMRWNIAGAYYMGRMSSKIESDGTWTFLNDISLPVESWDQTVACEVWFGSSFVSVTWNKSKKVPTLPASIKCLQMCTFCVRFVLVVCILQILVICIHLSSTYI